MFSFPCASVAFFFSRLAFAAGVLADVHFLPRERRPLRRCGRGGLAMTCSMMHATAQVGTWRGILRLQLASSLLPIPPIRPFDGSTLVDDFQGISFCLCRRGTIQRHACVGVGVSVRKVLFRVGSGWDRERGPAIPPF